MLHGLALDLAQLSAAALLLLVGLSILRHGRRP
jgi:hypothetical protein